jgi:transposase InsO family protein
LCTCWSNLPLHSSLALDALEQAPHARPFSRDLVHHCDRGVQNLWIHFTVRLAEAGIERSVGSVGDSYDSALAETVNGLYETEEIRRRGPWRNVDAVEYATLEWVHWSIPGGSWSPSGTCRQRRTRKRTIGVKPPKS